MGCDEKIVRAIQKIPFYNIYFKLGKKSLAFYFLPSYLSLSKVVEPVRNYIRLLFSI